MRIYDIISKKKKGEKLSADEINFFVTEYTVGNIPDYQVSALLMAICLKGMDTDETAALTAAIADSGDRVELSSLGDSTVDKHSTGGVGDKTTLIVAPIAAALGCKVAKMSGRGLGHTGGTIDKLESFPGYNTSLSPDKFISQVEKIGIAVTGQSGNLAPADKKLYALRDVTATVDSIPLISSSVMGKKLAAGSKSIVLDVKCGSGAFVKTDEQARILAQNMVDIGRACGRRTRAIITDMDTPLGSAVGNILEVKEAIDTLKGNGPRDLTEISVMLAATMVSLAHGISIEEATRRASEALTSGAALEKFKEWIAAQGGDTTLINAPENFPTAKYSFEVKAELDGYISHIDAQTVGIAAMTLGAGRASKDDEIDYSAGIILRKKTADYVKKGDTVATVYTNDKEKVKDGAALLYSAYTFKDSPPTKRPLILGYV